VTLNVDISNPSGDWSMVKQSSIRAAACAAWNTVKNDETVSEVSIVLADDAFIQDLNARFWSPAISERRRKRDQAS
jgi:ssRNA-specific RNase YbeY (16S rRNA maturation enzyme)